MELNEKGYLRPSLSEKTAPVPGAERIFQRGCPGVQVTAPAPPPDAKQDRLLGPYVGIWQAWSTDEEIRLAGSSGGVLTALHTWLLGEGHATQITGAAADARAPRRTVPVTITTRDA